MKQFLFWACLAMLTSIIQAESQVTIVLQSIPAYTPASGPIYIAGDLNGWDPGAAAQALQKNQSGLWQITLPAKNAGTVIQFKFTRGSWATVEKGTGGEEISNRSYTFGPPETIYLSIANWADNNGTVTTTAAKNVIRISENFQIPQLGRTRRIWLYLPPDYAESQKSYPVLYMHDGQNVFDSFTSFAGEWNVDESLNELAAQGYEVPIVVAIDNGGVHRMDEYSPWHNADYGGGEGQQYVDFLVNTLKPYIDSAYRTKRDRENTGIMGSSMGGLISFYAAFSRPDIFGKAGIFSPSYWFSPSIWPFVRNAEKRHPMLVYQLVGSLEGGTMPSDMLAMQDTLRKFGYSANELKSNVVNGGQHNELFWRTNFKEAFLWLFPASSGLPDQTFINKGIKLYPNPARNLIFMDRPEQNISVNLKIYDIAGACVAAIHNFAGCQIDLNSLPPGKYLLTISGGKNSWSDWFIKL